MHPGCAGVPNREPGTRNREPHAPWVRGRLARIRAILRVPGVRASRTENQEPGTENHVHPGCAGVPNREPRTRNREPRASLGARASRPHARNPARPWERGRPARMRRLRAEALAEHLEAPAGLWRRASLGARASRPHTRNPARAGCAGVPARIRAILRVPGCAGVPARMCKVLPLL